MFTGYVTPAGACVDGGTEVWQYGICFIDSNSSGTCRHATGTHFFATARIATDPRGDSECYFSITSDTEVIAFSPSDQFCLVEVISCAAGKKKKTFFVSYLASIAINFNVTDVDLIFNLMQCSSRLGASCCLAPYKWNVLPYDGKHQSDESINPLSSYVGWFDSVLRMVEGSRWPLSTRPYSHAPQWWLSFLQVK